MKSSTKTLMVATVLLLVFLPSSVLAVNRLEALRGAEATLEETLYMRSSKALKRMSLGYYGLLANIYWTRAVQYFGGHLRGAQRYDLLAPLLDITTDLDPQLIVAYQSGAIFLAEPVPHGAGQPDKAVALLQKGIRANPSYWRFYFTMGFIHYLERHDFKAAQQAFEQGSQVPGAMPWMKVMAARMAEQGQDTSTAMLLWKGIYDTNPDPMVRDTALKHILSLQAELEINELENQVKTYRTRTGTLPVRWGDMVRAGLIRGIPVDPAGYPFRLMPDGTVEVERPGQFPFLVPRRR